MIKMVVLSKLDQIGTKIGGVSKYHLLCFIKIQECKINNNQNPITKTWKDIRISITVKLFWHMLFFTILDDLIGEKSDWMPYM